jgi:thiol-disulfide isomerase/thioredoxin
MAVSALLALLIGIYSAHLYRVQQQAAPDSVKLEGLSLADLDGTMQYLDRWQGNLLLVNFWATWCPPCIEEIPLFMRLRDRYRAQGFEVIGIAIDEAEKVRRFQQQRAVDYPLLLGGEQGIALMQRFNNRLGALPYSVLFDRQGNAVHFKPGAYSESELESLLQHHLQQQDNPGYSRKNS